MRLKQISKRSLAIILSVLMVFSTLMVGTISTANAADISANTSGANFDSGSMLYLKANVWNNNNNERFAAYFYGNGNSETWVDMTKVNGETEYYEVEVPNTSNGNGYSNVIFCRMDGKNTENNWDNKWNQTNDLYPSDDNNCYEITGWGNDENSPSPGKWTKYTPTVSKYTVTIGASTGGTISVTYKGTTKTNGSFDVTAGEKITLSNTPNAGYKFDDYKVGSSTIISTNDDEYEYEPKNDITISGEFSKQTYDIIDSSTNGNVVVTKNGTTVNNYQIGDTLTFTATPNEGYSSNGKVTVKGTEYNSPYTVTVGESLIGNITTSATFDAIDPNKEYSITYNENKDGVRLTHPNKAKYNDSVEIIVNVESGYTCTIVYVNGTSYKVTNGKVTFNMPASDVVLTTNATNEVIETDYRYIGYSSKDNIDPNYDHKTMIQGTMGGEPFAYYEVSERNNTNYFLVSLKNGDPYPVYQNNQFTVYYDHDKKYGDYEIQQHLDGTVAKPGTSDAHYIVVYYPNKTYTWNGKTITTNSTPLIVAYSELPGDTYKEKFSVKMHHGSDDKITGKSRGDSYLDGVSGQTNVKYDREGSDRTVTFTTDTTYLDNNTDYNYTGYYQKVYGYHIIMTVEETDAKGNVKKTTRIDSVHGDKISSPQVGSYTATYTFPDNIISADVTPVFISSDDYLKSKNIGTTTVYLKLTPGNNTLDNTWKPNYYTWRDNDEDRIVDVKLPDGTTAKLSSDPDGNYPGQKMLYVGANMYMAQVETALLGILFNDGDNGTTQTFDYDEFIKLQNLGYNNITFEVKESAGETVAVWMNNTKSSDGNKVYAEDTTEIVDTNVITSESTSNEFFLDTNIEGYYIDVFGNKLLDEKNNPILQSDVRNAVVADNTSPFNVATKLNDVTTSLEIKKLFQTMGIDFNDTDKCVSLYGARYGWYTETEFYGMEYATRVYYFDHKTKMVSQQISGYGTIEGAQSPLDGNKTNAQYVTDGNLPGVNLQAAQGYKANGDTKDIKNGYELIPDTYKGVPFLVSYKKATKSPAVGGDKPSDYTRVDGKWYYQASIPQITVNMKTGFINNGSLVMDGDVIADQGTTYGSATIDGGSCVTVNQGTQVTIMATPKEGYKFVGFYDSKGNLITPKNPDRFTCAIGADIYAVFQELGRGTLTITNSVYHGNSPKDGGGNGTVGVKLTIFNKDGSIKETLTGSSSVTAQIQDGDSYQWELTGKPLGVDKFIGFRQPEEQADGNYYYSLLDAEYINSDGSVTPQPIFDSNTGVYSYKSDLITDFNWDDYSSESLSFNFYTDFRKVSVYATLKYKYFDRFGLEKTYIVKDVLLDDDEIENNFLPRYEKIAQHAPPIDEVYTDCKWICSENDTSYIEEYASSTATLVADQTTKKFTTIIQIGENVENPQKRQDLFNTLVVMDAPSVDSHGNAFVCWKQYDIDSDGAIDEDSGVVFSYNKYIGVKVSFNRAYKAIYEGKAEDFITNVQNPIYTREKYTDQSGNLKDYIYTDFLVQFETSLGGTFKDFVANNSDKIQFGLVLERDTTFKYEGGEKTTPTSTPDNLKNTILKLSENLTGDVEETNGWTVCDDTTSLEYNNYYYLFDLTGFAPDLTDFGRFDYIIKFENNEFNRSVVYNAYTYIIYTDDNGEQHIYISDPRMMNIYDMGIKVDGE